MGVNKSVNYTQHNNIQKRSITHTDSRAHTGEQPPLPPPQQQQQPQHLKKQDMKKITTSSANTS